MNDIQLVEELVSGVKEVFSTMIMVDVNDTTAFSTDQEDETVELTSIIGFGGDLTGMVAIQCSGLFARKMTASFLGMEIAEIDDDVIDAVGEVANMVAGSMKTSFKRQGKDITIAIPNTVVGKGLKLCGVAGTAGHIIFFESVLGTFRVELKYKKN